MLQSLEMAPMDLSLHELLRQWRPRRRFLRSIFHEKLTGDQQHRSRGNNQGRLKHFLHFVPVPPRYVRSCNEVRDISVPPINSEKMQFRGNLRRACFPLGSQALGARRYLSAGHERFLNSMFSQHCKITCYIRLLGI
jgi:hypothetical protein